ncbi:MAG: hypothetical protein IJE97_01025 [Thermoguttaceae bacterium]|nr:hypothetical protein [Thermoguttaceae bacterium]MBQ7110197.1 hypothetical protein [Thermoguttaceae bacterium]
MQRINEPNLPRVVGGQPISAADWNRIVDRINAGATGTVRAGLPLRRALRELRVRNDSAGPLGYLSVVAVYGFASPQVDLVTALNDAAVLSVGPPTGAAGEFLATLREPLLPGGVGTATAASGTAFLAEVVGANDSASLAFATPATDAANAGKLVASPTGPFRIVARSDSGVCLLTPKPKEETKVPEIFFATVAASWTQNGARNAEISITYYDRTAGATVSGVALSPLSRENDLLAEGTQILVVKTVDGAIYLLNAECPQ